VTLLRHLGILILIYLCVIAQTSLVSTEAAGLGRPYLPAAVLVVIAVSCHATSILWSGLLGLVLDALSPDRLGLQLAIAAMLGLGLQVLQPMWRSRSRLALVAMVLLTSFAWRALSPMCQAVLAGRVVDPQIVLTNAVQDAVWTGIVAGVFILVGRSLFGSSRSPIVVAPPRQRWGTTNR